MQFLNPWLLLGTLGIAVPIVIHLLNRYRFRQVDWAAMELLRRALIVRSRRLKLEDLLLLALRCLAVLLVALALARPTLTPRGASWTGGQADVGVVVAVDASFSMDHRPNVQSRMDRAVERLREVLQTLKPGSPTTLVLLGDRPRARLRNVGYEADRFEEALKAIAPLPERLNLELGLVEVQILLEEIKAPHRECYLISDAQAGSWGRLSDQARQTLGRMEAQSRVFFLPVAGEQAENVTLSRFELKSGLLRRGGSGRYEADLHNVGRRTRENVLVQLYVDDEPAGHTVVGRLEPGRPVTVELVAQFRKEGIARLSVRLGPDELLMDNVRYAVADIRGRTRILYVRPPLDEGKADYLLTALLPRPSEAMAVDAISWLDLPTRRLADYQLVILSDVPDLPDEQVRLLYHFVRQGGGLLVVLGENTQPEIINERFQQEGVSFLPAAVQPLAEDATEQAAGWFVEPTEHPIARVLRGLPEELRKEARVYRGFPLRLAEGARPILKLAGGEVMAAEKPLGRGRVVVFGTMADRSWNNLAVETGFYPMLLHETVGFLGRQVFEKPLTVSMPLALPLPETDAGESSVLFREPSGRGLTMPAVVRGGQRYAEIEQVELPGFYEVNYSPEAPPLVAAVNVAPEEGDVRCLTAEQRGEAFQGTRVRIVEETEEVGGVVRESRVGREFWKELLLLGLAAFLLETLLARWFTRRAAAGSPAALAKREAMGT